MVETRWELDVDKLHGSNSGKGESEAWGGAGRAFVVLLYVRHSLHGSKFLNSWTKRAPVLRVLKKLRESRVR